MKILMTKTVQGSLDGVTVRELAAGELYDTVASPRGDRLGRYHIKQGVAMAAPTRITLAKVPAQQAAE